ncbi:MAG: ribokinase [Gordonia sp. (in: high G+C Gram-positive bacteria)]|uniref:ribokinase n=1 Tax=Gordonia sp. (in: high G+C Gram-positive bacteria) TaxID=84139 RepID=UPI003C75398F
MTSVVVVGSINLDVITRCERFPDPGETLAGIDVHFGPGGKGANQARAASMAGAEVSFIGAVGDDAAATTAGTALRDAGVTTHLATVSGPTGVAAITVDGSGENMIVVVPGANAELALSPADRNLIAASDVLLLQLEIPPPVVLDAARTARAAGTVVVLNPSPVREVPDELWSLIDAAVVNETEEAALTEVLARVPTVVTTLGSRGARMRWASGSMQVDGQTVDVVDTTGAGDAFTGTLAANWHLSAAQRLTLANTAGALATTTMGA